jgi:hypothetical protein
MSNEFLDFLASAKKGSTNEKIERIMETIEVLSSIVGDKLPTVVNQQIASLQQQIDQINQKLSTIAAGGGARAPAAGPPPPGGKGGPPPPPGIGGPSGPPPMPGGGGPPPPPGARPGGAGPMSLKASIMDELKQLLAKRKAEEE